MNRVAKIGLGCLLLPVGMTVLGLLFFLTMKAAGVPDPSVTEKEFSQDIGTQLVIEDDSAWSSTERIDDNAATSRLAASTAVIVDIDVEECTFFLESGPASDGVRIEASYDEATYELTRSYDLDGDIPVFRLKFRSKISFWRRIAQDGTFSDEDFAMNEITVFLPENTPIALRSRIAKGEGEMLLDNLVLTNLVTHCTMGEYTIEMSTPNPVTMEFAKMSMSMGEGTMRGLSNLRARSLRIEGGMGEARIDFGTSLLVDTELIARMKMGEIPDDALYDPQSRVKATMGEVVNGMDRGQRISDPELAKRINLDASVLMGAIQLDPFRVRPSSRFGN